MKGSGGLIRRQTGAPRSVPKQPAIKPAPQPKNNYANRRWAR